MFYLPYSSEDAFPLYVNEQKGFTAETFIHLGNITAFFDHMFMNIFYIKHVILFLYVFDMFISITSIFFYCFVG